MQEIYKDFVIEYHEFDNSFVARIGISEYKNKELGKVRDKIDRLLKPEFKRVSALLHESYNISSKYCVVDVTSLDSVEEAWVITDKNSRSKQHVKKLFENTESNLKIFNSIKEMEVEIKNITDKIDEKFKELKNIELKAGLNALEKEKDDSNIGTC
jgi:hypothetical protein